MLVGEYLYNKAKIKSVFEVKYRKNPDFFMKVLCMGRFGFQCGM